MDEVTPDSSSTDEVPDSAVNAGFPGIGAASGNTGGFNAIFEGNGNTIANFYSRNTAGTAYTGLFRSTDSNAQIRSLGVTNGNVYGGIGASDQVGVLVGVNRGTIIASSASGSADGGAGNTDGVGGLVGNNAGTIIASYAIGDGNDATIDVNGGNGNTDSVGGLVGNNAGTIIASYATGSADGGDGILTMSVVWWDLTLAVPSPQAMPLVVLTGELRFLTLSVALVGSNRGTITASYATGDADGGTGNGDFVGILLGQNLAGVGGRHRKLRLRYGRQS